MPYHIEVIKYDKRPFKIVDEEGNIRGSSITREDAESSIRARLAGEHGWKPTGKKKS